MPWKGSPVTSDYHRYLIAWVPQAGTPLARFGVDWTGRCADDLEPGHAWRRNSAIGMTGRHWDIAMRGLHGTLSKPFQLAPGRSRWRLDDALRAAARTMPALALPGFELDVVDGRVALVPRHFCGAAERLQDRVADVVHLVATQAGGAAVDTTGFGLIPAGVAAGAPQIPRFALPLTDRLPPQEARRSLSLLRPRIAGMITQVHMLDDLALLGDTGPGRRWRLLERYRLAECPLEMRKRRSDPLQCADESELPPLEAVMGTDWNTVIA